VRAKDNRVDKKQLNAETRCGERIANQQGDTCNSPEPSKAGELRSKHNCKRSWLKQERDCNEDNRGVQNLAAPSIEVTHSRAAGEEKTGSVMATFPCLDTSNAPRKKNCWTDITGSPMSQVRIQTCSIGHNGNTVERVKS